MPDGDLINAGDAGEALAPHSIEAEQALLGSLLFDNETYYRVSDFLRAEHFYEPVHGRIFDAAARLIIRNDVADEITLAAMANHDEGLKSLGGADYLAELAAAHASAAAAKDYGRFVYDLALRRDLIRVGGDIEKEAADDRDTPASDLIEDAERKLYALAETGSSSKGFVSFGQALAGTIELAAAAFERDGGLSGISTGLTDLDNKLGGLHASDLIILAGRPSMGKTALATNIAFNIALRHRREADPTTGEMKSADGGVVGFFSLEMSSEQLALRLLAERAAISSHRIRRGDIDVAEFETVRDAANEIVDAPLHIDDTGGLSIAALAARARRMKRTVGLDCLVVDYLQLVTPSGHKRTDGRVQEVSEITQGLKALAKELDVPVLALSQLSRAPEARTDRRPQLSDLRESGSLEQDADVVMFIYRPHVYGIKSKDGDTQEGLADISIGKQRNGPTDTVQLMWEDRCATFENLAPGFRREEEE
ncbi:MAG: replicative DNA helicase, partial [Caulobacterales bacterium]|nr:replicative DNA helicase [Caulobacterales bacterium]